MGLATGWYGGRRAGYPSARLLIYDRVSDSYAIVPVDLRLVRQASELVDRHTRHGLRALDALQLAAALEVAGGAPGDVTLVCFDRRLWRSARDEGFECLPRAQP